MSVTIVRCLKGNMMQSLSPKSLVRVRQKQPSVAFILLRTLEAALPQQIPISRAQGTMVTTTLPVIGDPAQAGCRHNHKGKLS